MLPQDGPVYTESLALLDQPNSTGGIWFEGERSLRQAQQAFANASCNTVGTLGDGIRHAAQAGKYFQDIVSNPAGSQESKDRAVKMLSWCVFYLQGLRKKEAECRLPITAPPDPTKEPEKQEQPQITAEDAAIRAKIIACIVKRDCGSLRGFDQYAGGGEYLRLFRDLTIIPFEYRQFQNKGGQAVLLFGPPGSGKSALAEAVAAGLNGSFISISAADLKGKFVGESEKSIKCLYEVARELTKTKDGKTLPTVVFVDELEGVVNNSSQSESSTGILSEFNKQLQGVGSANAGVVTLVATNFPGRIPASAISRFGDARLYVGIPTLPALEEYFYLLFAQMPDTFKDSPCFESQTLTRKYQPENSPFAQVGLDATFAQYWNFKFQIIYDVYTHVANGSNSRSALWYAHFLFGLSGERLLHWIKERAVSDGNTKGISFNITTGDKDSFARIIATEQCVKWEREVVSTATVVPVLAALAWIKAWSLRDASTFWQVLKRTCARRAADFVEQETEEDMYRYFILDQSAVTRTKNVNGRCVTYKEGRNVLVPMGLYRLNGNVFEEVRNNTNLLTRLGDPALTQLSSQDDVERYGVMTMTKGKKTTFFARRPHVTGTVWSKDPTGTVVNFADMLGHAPASYELVLDAMEQVKASKIDGVQSLIQFMKSNGRLLTPGESQQTAIERLVYAEKVGNGDVGTNDDDQEPPNPNPKPVFQAPPAYIHEYQELSESLKKRTGAQRKGGIRPRRRSLNPRGGSGPGSQTQTGAHPPVQYPPPGAPPPVQYPTPGAPPTVQYPPPGAPPPVQYPPPGAYPPVPKFPPGQYPPLVPQPAAVHASSNESKHTDSEQESDNSGDWESDNSDSDLKGAEKPKAESEEEEEEEVPVSPESQADIDKRNNPPRVPFSILTNGSQTNLDKKDTPKSVTFQDASNQNPEGGSLVEQLQKANQQSEPLIVDNTKTMKPEANKPVKKEPDLPDQASAQNKQKSVNNVGEKTSQTVGSVKIQDE